MNENCCKGATFVSNLVYIKKIVGESGPKKVQAALDRSTVKLDLEKITEKDWLPLETRLAFLEAVKTGLNWDDKRIFAMGNDAVNHSAVIKLLLGYFMSVNTAIKFSPDIWARNYTCGEMLIITNEKGFGRLALNDFKGTPIMCAYLRGFFHGVGASLAKAKNVQVREDKCQHRGDPRCEYTFTWVD